METKWVRTLVKLKFWLYKHTTNGKLLGSFISPLEQRYQKYIFPTQIYFPTLFPSSMEKTPKTTEQQNQKVQHYLSSFPSLTFCTSLQIFFWFPHPWTGMKLSSSGAESFFKSSRLSHTTWYRKQLTHVYFTKHTFHLWSW